MLVEKVENPPMTQASHRSTFFRQSGWLMIANIVGGMLMYGVHLLGKATGKSEYGLFGTLLVAVMLVPAVPLQMVLAQQTAKALATGRERELAGIVRMIWLGLFGLWAVGCIGVLLLQNHILRLWDVANPVALWVTLPAILLSLLGPIFTGVLQGQQNFFWLAWSMLANGIVRVGVAVVVVLVLHAGAVGMMVGVLAGVGASMLIALWQTQSLWRLAPLPFNWPSLLRQVVPLLLGFVFVQFLFTGDTMFVKHYFTGDETGPYVSAGTLSRALIWLVSPLASVMFPRIVHSTAKSEKTNLMNVVLIGTAIMAAGGAIGIAIVGPWVIKLAYGQSFVQVAAAVLPWYAAAMVPLALVNVLVNNLLARSQFGIVPFAGFLAIAYAVTQVLVTRSHHNLVLVLQILGLFNLLLLAVCAWFTWRGRVRSPQAEVQSPESVA
jgi:O-antigen/teichoic acid export membrane protein